jgi:hypothetical protein
VGFEPDRAEVVPRGEADVGVERGGEAAQQGNGGLGAAFLDALNKGCDDVGGMPVQAGCEHGHISWWCAGRRGMRVMPVLSVRTGRAFARYAYLSEF